MFPDKAPKRLAQGHTTHNCKKQDSNPSSPGLSSCPTGEASLGNVGPKALVLSVVLKQQGPRGPSTRDTGFHWALPRRWR